MKILFSPIGSSDPIRNNYDGSFLHILRHYKPDKVYLFMSKEMYALHELGNFYVGTAEKLLPSCEYEVIKDEEMIDPSDFGMFDDLFKSLITNINSEFPDAEILLNLSSGTPQMKASLHMLSVTLPFITKGLQVQSPEKAANRAATVGDNYDIELEWEQNIDNEVDEKRVKEVAGENIVKMIATENIKKMISSYNYAAAYELAKNDEGLLGKDVVCILEAAKLRVNLKIKEAKQAVSKLGLKETDFFGEIRGREEIVYEYILYLAAKVKNGQYTDFARGVTPVTDDLYEEWLKNIYKTDINKWCIKKNGGRFLSLNRVDDEFKEKFLNKFKERFEGKEYREDYINSYIISIIIDVFAQEQGTLNILKNEKERIGTFIRVIRNPAAHEIVGIDNSVIKEKLKEHKEKIHITIEKILEDLKKVYLTAYGVNNSDELWQGYEKMNKVILEKLDF